MEGGDPLSNPRHERFALLLASGEASAAEAYRSEISQKASKATVETEGPKLARSPQVALRISWLKAEAERKAREVADDAVMTIAEKRLFLARVKRMKGAAIDEDADGDLINGIRYDKQGRRMLVLPDKIAAIKLDNDLAGDGSEANKEMVVVVKIGGTDNADD